MPHVPHLSFSTVDVVGVGINATDTIIRLPHFPALDSKVEISSVERKAGGQVASAMVACQRWGLRTRYIGKIGDDAAGDFQKQEMSREGVETHWIIAPGCASQSAFILVDEISGERTVLWRRDPSIALRPENLNKHFIFDARALLVDGHDTSAAACAARWAREERIEVVGDFDNLYPGVEEVLQSTDFAIVSKDFPERLTGESNLLKSLPEILHKFKCRLTAATLGRLGVLAWDGTRFLLCPGFKVNAVDTTGAGDIFHGAFLYGLIKKWPLHEILEFSCAAAVLNCTAVGARGNIASLQVIDELRRFGERLERAFEARELLESSAPVHRSNELDGSIHRGGSIRGDRT
jgi:sulfofructose kinase